MIPYVEIFAEQVKKLTELQERQRQTQAEIEKVTQMVKASFDLLSNEEQFKFVDMLTDALEQVAKREIGLTEAMRTLLQSKSKEWFNAVRVRDALKATGFSFEGYTSNPLASVHAVLKRFKRSEVKARKGTAGLWEYRWIQPSPPKSFAYPAMNPVAFANRLISSTEEVGNAAIRPRRKIQVSSGSSEDEATKNNL